MKLVLSQSFAGVDGPETAYVEVVGLNPRERGGWLSEVVVNMMVSLEEQLEAHFQPNTCKVCGGVGPVMGAIRVNDERVTFCAPCYPELMSDPAMVAQLE